MPETLEIIPEGVESRPLFSTEDEYERFRESYEEAVRPIQEKWKEARRLSEEESRHRLLL